MGRYNELPKVRLISKNLVVMGPLTSILVNSVLSLSKLFQGLKIYSDLKYTFAKNAHLYDPSLYLLVTAKKEDQK